MAAGVAEMFNVGPLFTITVVVAVAVQPLAAVAVTVYTVVAVGLAVTVAPEPVTAGAQLKPVMPLPAAFSVTVAPLHTGPLFEALTDGAPSTLTVTVI
jgi:phage shock protein PspC (stress-responsive transcriptional regulator)